MVVHGITVTNIAKTVAPVVLASDAILHVQVVAVAASGLQAPVILGQATVTVEVVVKNAIIVAQVKIVRAAIVYRPSRKSLQYRAIAGKEALQQIAILMVPILTMVVEAMPILDVLALNIFGVLLPE